MWFTYILKCSDNTFYTGVTTDLKRRLDEHNGKGVKGAKYTRNKRPVKLVYSEERQSRSDACKRESAIKSLNRTQKLKVIHGIN